ncbi:MULTISPECIES: CaiB/BaiF CoA-transferase family protein [unclassified Rhodococcus (in: high G+C Gram-positive bacteria)]|uniref:CaiB/BaiF CoA transferase family protein n=1 Tax=unclassified Rhodococcus (in: high G+C Gram-positive bacteria) TaxID=192944 RepID=UPI00163A20E7|nr:MULTISPECIES: CoA transferase [unclassified Rhodococcus (in: high G+C Gram-positive bacteria)]MBC2639481.1 CoA transferase [Rhodococcus sp. 3A]MBC2895774.1 CoA transferase [Rhodococcus sp. 4CII]
MSGYSLLDGVRILEVAQLAPSSLGGHLADLGADVIKIESGPLGDPVRIGGSRAVGCADGPAFMHLRWNRGKRSVALDLRTTEGKQAFLDIARSCDAVIEGMRGGYLDWLGIGYEALRQVNPKIVLCTVSGMGTDGPYRVLGTGGPVFDAYAGLREVSTPAEPPTEGMAGSTTPPIAMYALGAYGAMGLLAALRKAGATGVGCHVEVAGIDVAAAWMPDAVDAELNRDRSMPRPSWLPDGRLPDWPRLEAYRTSDGEAILFGSHVEKFWHNFLVAVEREDLIGVDLTSTDHGAPARADLVWRALTEIFARRTRAEWVQLFLEHGIAGGPVNNVADMLADPHFQARENTYRVDYQGVGELEFVVSPVRVAGEKFAPTLPPVLGADTTDVLRSVAGYDDRRIAAATDPASSRRGASSDG